MKYSVENLRTVRIHPDEQPLRTCSGETREELGRASGLHAALNTGTVGSKHKSEVINGHLGTRVARRHVLFGLSGMVPPGFKVAK